MIRRIAISFVFPVLLACLISGLQSRHPVENMLFKLGLYDIDKDRESIKKVIKQFNIDYATVFNSGGSTSVLNEYPASNLIKRRTYQEANLWAAQKMVLVYDRDMTEIEDMRFYSPFRAVVVARERWFLNFQDIETRDYLSPLKADRIRVRYLLRKYPQKGWIVEEYEVFSDEEKVTAEVDKVW